MNALLNLINFKNPFTQVEQESTLLKCEMEKILRVFNLSLESREDLKNNPVTFVNHGKDAVIIRCKDISTGCEFKMKLIDIGKKDEVILYYGGIKPLRTQEKPMDFNGHQIIQLQSEALDYITRLVSGKACGLFLGGKEDRSFSIMIKA